MIKDTLLCEYDGIGVNEGIGKYRKWKEKLASGNKYVTLIRINNSKFLYFDPGSAQYYMGDSDITLRKPDGSSFPNALYQEKEDQFTTDGFIPASQLLEEYELKLISWEPSQPIKNSFSSKKKK